MNAKEFKGTQKTKEHKAEENKGTPKNSNQFHINKRPLNAKEHQGMTRSTKEWYTLLKSKLLGLLKNDKESTAVRGFWWGPFLVLKKKTVY